MKKESSLEEWKKLYDIAIKIKELKPWEDINNPDIIEVSDAKERSLCNISGFNNLFYGVMAYCGDVAIDNYLYLLECGDELPIHQHLRYQNCLVCNFVDRNELPSREYKLIKELGLKFRGKGEWIFFSAWKKDYEPERLNREEVLKLTKKLEQVYEILVDARVDKLSYKKELGEIPARIFDKKRKLWVTGKGQLLAFDYVYPMPALTDELLMRKLKKAKKLDTELALDILSIPVPLVNNIRYGDEMPLLGLAILADIDSEMIISEQNVIPDEDMRVESIFDQVIPYILNVGKPSMIVVRDKYVGSFIMDLCQKLDIQIALAPTLPVIDEFIEGVLESIFEDEIEEFI